MKTLVIAEKPSVGKDIARVLGGRGSGNGYIEGNQYIVTWGLGHLVTLADPESYHKDYKEWKMEHLPMMPEKLQTEVIPQTRKQYQTVKNLIHRSDVGSIVIATDAGREGELVARWILLKAKNQKPCKRLWISSVTDKAIREGFAHLKDAKEYENLYFAAVSRAEADWLVGINATRALTCKYNAQLSCGRVQTPTLYMIAKREEEIRTFRPEPYYGISIQSEGIQFTWKEEKSNSYRTFSKDKAEEIIERIKDKPFQLVKVEKKGKKTFPPQLYDLTELQRDANKKFGYSAKETLNIMQRLYESHKVLTYPRTDSRYITTDVVGTIKERLKACSVGIYKKLAAPLIMSKIEGKPSYVNNSKVTDHHAIIPTEQYPELSHMTNEEKKIYDLVVKRFLAVLYPPCEYEETTLVGEMGGERFYARGKVILQKGWRAVYEGMSDSDSLLEEDNEEEEAGDGGRLGSRVQMGGSLKQQVLPKLTQNQKMSKGKLTLTEGKTRPPAYFNEATLLSAMENPVKYMDSKDAAMAKTLGETGGLGTVATRADIIEKLFSTFYIEKKGKDIHVTSKGKQVLELVPEDLKKPELTAEWEMKLSQIAKGQLKKDRFLTGIRTYTQEIVDEIKKGQGTYRHDNLTNKVCQNCGKRLLAVNGKNAKMLVCQDRECGYRETLSRTSNARCPVCHKKMELVGSGEKSTFVCSCGRKESLEKFQERKKKEGAGVSKKDVAKYLQKQEDVPINNAFAAAFAKLNISDKK